MRRKISLESLGAYHLERTLQLKAHPLWGRIIWKHLERSGQLDENALKSIGVSRAALWGHGEQLVYEWTYGKWFSALKYGYAQCGSHFGLELAEYALTYSPPFCEVIVQTCPDFRTWLDFMKSRAAKLEPLLLIEVVPARGGVTLHMNYPMSGLVREAFCLSAVAVMDNVSRIITGTNIRGIKFGMSDQRGLWKSIENRLEVVVDSWGECASDVEIFFPDSMLDEPSIGSDPIRQHAALVEYNFLCDKMRAVMPTASICDLVVSLQITSSKIYSMAQMADKLEMGTESYRKSLAKHGTNHKTLIGDCVRYNAKHMQDNGMSNQEICHHLSINKNRLRRYLDSGQAANPK